MSGLLASRVVRVVRVGAVETPPSRNLPQTMATRSLTFLIGLASWQASRAKPSCGYIRARSTYMVVS